MKSLQISVRTKIYKAQDMVRRTETGQAYNAVMEKWGLHLLVDRLKEGHDIEIRRGYVLKSKWENI